VAGWLAGFVLDAKLGVRMLARYPGLTVVCGLAMAFAIAAGAGTFELIGDMVHPRVPLPDGERIVGISYWDRARNDQGSPGEDDLIAWREALTTVEDVGGFRSLRQNLAPSEGTADAGGEGIGEPLTVARMSAAGFRVARVPPLLGRALAEADEAPGAPEVVVLGYRTWQTRFGGDPAVVNRTVRVGDIAATVIGVMPEGFAFPVNHDLWAPLRLAEPGGDPAQARSVVVFGRLASAATLQEVQAELTTVAARRVADAPERYEHLRPEVAPHAASIVGNFSTADTTLPAVIYAINAFPALFLILVCGNVGLLMFARAATRERELLVRNALGASRARIIAQLFVEALVLGAFALMLGLPAARLALQRAVDAIYGVSGPFWIDAALSPRTVVYAAALTLLAAAIAGIVPALKVTGRRVESRLRRASAGGDGLRLGLTWRALIVAQIAATVVFAAFAYLVQRQAAELLPETVGFEAEQYVVVPVGMDTGSSSASSEEDQERLVQRYAALIQELEQLVAADLAVAAVTLAERLPLMDQALAAVELDGGGTPDRASGIAETEHARPGFVVVNTTAVAPDFFEAFNAPVLAGRGFDSRDLAAGADAVVVNESFVDRILGGGNPLGRRIRYAAAPDTEPGPWYEIVGAVRNLVRDRRSSLVGLDEEVRAHLYHPLSLDRLAAPGADRAWRYPLHLAVHARGDVATLAPALRRIAGELSPTLRLEISTIADAANDDARFWRFSSRGILLVSGMALFLSLAGIYSVMSFTVSRRTREIGVRVALGGTAPRVVAEIFRRPVRLVVAGVVTGCLLMGTMMAFLIAVFGLGRWDGLVIAKSVALLAALGIVTVAVCALACIGPTRRALRVEPTEALSTEV
jgi:predicted permease